MAYICLNCGSITWTEVVERVETYTIDHKGGEEEIARRYGEVLYRHCAKCVSEDNLLEFDLYGKPEIAKRLISIENGKERLKEFLIRAYNDEFWVNTTRGEIMKRLKELGVSEDEILAGVL